MKNLKLMQATGVMVVLAALIVVQGTAGDNQKHHSLKPRTETSRAIRSSDIPVTDEQMMQNDIDDRIIVGEPYKSLIQTTARFALAQSKISNHVHIDTAMRVLNNASWLLAKPKNLMKVFKMIAVTMASLTATIFFFPGAWGFLRAAWEDPSNTMNLDKYLTNGISERSALSMLTSKADDALSRVGLDDSSCRERSLCYLGEILKCSFPYTSESLARIASDSFSGTNLRENVYSRAFLTGFIDHNCTKVMSEGEDSHNCLSNFFNTILNGNEQRAKTKRHV